MLMADFFSFLSFFLLFCGAGYETVAAIPAGMRHLIQQSDPGCSCHDLGTHLKKKQQQQQQQQQMAENQDPSFN